MGVFSVSPLNYESWYSGISPYSSGQKDGYNDNGAIQSWQTNQEDVAAGKKGQRADDADRVKGKKQSLDGECETCEKRKYQDGSNEMVSFKAPGHIDPGNAAMVVLGHEREHVSNAYNKAELNNGEVKQASVRLKTAVCPECGRTYIAGGETTTQILYFNEENPYQKDLKESDADNKYRGANVDIAV